MRTLKFIVDGQTIRQDPSCDFSGLYPGTTGYLKAEFTFSGNWNGYTKVAAFWSPFGVEYPAQPLFDGNSCMIPTKALEKREFRVQIIGKQGDTRLTTNKVSVIQNGGG